MSGTPRPTGTPCPHCRIPGHALDACPYAGKDLDFRTGPEIVRAARISWGLDPDPDGEATP